ncbi:hypothetical protein D1B33_07995 [Lysinibacillus yapensis]|uniref:4-vinyl reductase 4VR domain-containing protein n=1 Tax=Ureibacillus yapensis TaxID=2304605 RepID=A0A396S950_9BACL|nr:helix-turn-helix domain-containing protein [Lysinibacillus yapensis]RHW37473.1 hypothetical protein D1B33_07995 [Lysinibacillus yapensis]
MMKTYSIETDIIITSHSFGLLRKTIIENMGIERAKKILMEFGKELGKSRALELLKSGLTKKELENSIPYEHVKLGHLSAITWEGAIDFDEEGTVKIDDLKGVWHDSFEMHIHKAFIGEASECSCYTLSGFASGILSTIFKEEIIVLERTCVSKGDNNCTFQVKKKTEWVLEGFEFSEQTILNEIEDTYDKLLENNNLLHKMTHYHSKLTECVAQQNDIQRVLQTANSILDIPIFVTDRSGRLTLHEGLSESIRIRIQSYPINMKQLTKTRIFKIENFYLLTSPIYIDNQLVGACSFLYLNNKIDPNDYLFLERLATVSSLCFLNEKIKFETTERLKISFLDRLINRQFKDNRELLNQAKYIKPQLANDYITLALKNNLITEEPIDIYNQVLQLARLLQLYHLDGFAAQKADHIIVFIHSINDYSLFKRKMHSIIDEFSNRYKNNSFSIGMSNMFTELENFHESLIQAEQAMNTPRNKRLVEYAELGLLGAFLQNMEREQIIDIAQKELKELLHDNPKSKELLYTLITYLKNAGKLEKTTQDLSLSLGGVQYRLRKIEEVIGKNLKDAETTSYLFLILESLFVIGEINSIKQQY